MALPSITSSWADTFGWWVGEWAFPALPPSLSHTRLSISLCARTSLWEPHLGNWELYHEYWGTPFLLSLTPSLTLSLSLSFSPSPSLIWSSLRPQPLYLSHWGHRHTIRHLDHTRVILHTVLCVCVWMCMCEFMKKTNIFSGKHANS